MAALGLNFIAGIVDGSDTVFDNGDPISNLFCYPNTIRVSLAQLELGTVVYLLISHCAWTNNVVPTYELASYI